MNNYKMRLLYILFLIYNKMYNKGNNELNNELIVNNELTVNNDVTKLYFDLENNDYIVENATNTVIKMNITKPHYEYVNMYDLRLM